MGPPSAMDGILLHAVHAVHAVHAFTRSMYSMCSVTRAKGSTTEGKNLAQVSTLKGHGQNDAFIG